MQKSGEICSILMLDDTANHQLNPQPNHNEPQYRNKTPVNYYLTTVENHRTVKNSPLLSSLALSSPTVEYLQRSDEYLCMNPILGFEASLNHSNQNWTVTCEVKHTVLKDCKGERNTVKQKSALKHCNIDLRTHEHHLKRHVLEK